MLHKQSNEEKSINSILREEKHRWWENIECIINFKAVFEKGSAVKSLN